MSIHTDLGISRFQERMLEILPGALSWGMIVLIIVLSFVNIVAVAIILISFALLWLFKIFGYSFRLVRGYYLLHLFGNIGWNERLSDLDDTSKALKYVSGRINSTRTPNIKKAAYKRYLPFLEHANQYDDRIDPDHILHGVIIAAYNESREIVESTVRSVIDSEYDMSKIILTIAYEERGGDDIKNTATELIEKYGHHFKEAWAVMHPQDIPGEAKAKAGNITYAAKRLAKYTEDNDIDPGKVIVTTLDADNRPDKNYFAYLTYQYCITPDREKKSYQPIAQYFNNIWDAPAITRVIAMSNGFWILMEAMRPHRLRNFSAHAQSLEGLIHMEYWNVKSIVEDGHQYWRAYFAYDGDHQVIPIYSAIYQDAVLAEGFSKTMKAQFIQLRRWAWGVSDTPYVIVKSLRNKKIPKIDLLIQNFRQIEGYFSWAVVPLILAFGAFIPGLVNPELSDNIIALQLPNLSQYIQTFSMVGLLAPAIASMMALPPRPRKYSWVKNISMALQWLLIPFTLIIFGCGAALNAQTRLMFGRYLEEFDVTVKTRQTSPVNTGTK